MDYNNGDGFNNNQNDENSADNAGWNNGQQTGDSTDNNQQTFNSQDNNQQTFNSQDNNQQTFNSQDNNQQTFNSQDNNQQSGNNWNNQQNGGWNNQSNGNSWNNQSNGNSWNNNQQNGNNWNNNGWNNNNNNNNNWNNNNYGWQQTPPPVQRQPIFINSVLNRPILKNEAKTFIKARYGILLAATIIPGLIAFGIGCIPYIGLIFEAIFAPVLYIGAYYLIIGIVRNKNYNLGNMFDVFNYFGNIFGASFTTNLFIFLWSLIAVIPVGVYFAVTGVSINILRYFNFGMNFGFPRMTYDIAVGGIVVLVIILTIICCIPAIYKSFCWIMVPYILADHPQMTGTQARQLSDDMMKGHKWEYFVYLLSFIGWFLLSACTFGILGLLYVNPYLGTANCDYYDNLRMLYEAQHQQPNYTENAGTF
ncbi:MAG: DUF975 family protein [Candidatus Weimeria sp.]